MRKMLDAVPSLLDTSSYLVLLFRASGHAYLSSGPGDLTVTNEDLDVVERGRSVYFENVLPVTEAVAMAGGRLF